MPHEPERSGLARFADSTRRNQACTDLCRNGGVGHICFRRALINDASAADLRRLSDRYAACKGGRAKTTVWPRVVKGICLADCDAFTDRPTRH
jgi:hypothetical protein